MSIFTCTLRRRRPAAMGPMMQHVIVQSSMRWVWLLVRMSESFLESLWATAERLDERGDVRFLQRCRLREPSTPYLGPPLIRATPRARACCRSTSSSPSASLVRRMRVWLCDAACCHRTGTASMLRLHSWCVFYSLGHASWTGPFFLTEPRCIGDKGYISMS